MAFLKVTRLSLSKTRAPRLVNLGPEVETLATRDGSPTLVRQGHLLAAIFHPELSEDRRVHQLFLDMVTQDKARHQA